VTLVTVVIPGMGASGAQEGNVERGTKRVGKWNAGVLLLRG